ncbi:monofunctional biosynthetic peptidoglycan transglycosylase [Chromobacterium sp. IIBBL 290-4]|uniref:monofunctional biosynthetic peptidoglycan transglycosylase n=1 Tax=Chromobacterium sp. IIBBL 290-4 TaxID=2953890 RepID=UPI0020B66679|nr:monofunctional biosynthetic peptidoglycan transglycosylase [Chromobacterium sp. IIBBL 290-4]UTH72518.1 monofunctional biosynthetic peptidoglycan transglycosylase [Chromobacterium sp. IIBBL 290-4]
MTRWILKILAALAAAFLLYNLWVLGHILYWRDHNPDASSFMTEQLAKLKQDDPDAELSHKWVPYDKISPNLKRALIAAEDAKFVDHEGFDWDGIEAAFEKNLKKGHIVAGGSTISQQLAKNLFLSSGKTPWRKLEEALITVMLEKTMDKRRIFEIYLNVIEWGSGVFGAEAASRHYFRTSASRLSSGQAAKLAAMVPNPRYYDDHRNAPGLAKKTRIIQRRMGYADLP